MFILFHLAIPLLIFEIPKIKQSFNFNRFALSIGAILADITDKPLLLLSLGSGRGFSHSLLFIGITYLILFFFLRNDVFIINSLAIGMSLHLFLDLPEVPLFAPFITYNYAILEDPIIYWLNKLLHDPLVQITELVGLAGLSYMIFSNKLFNFKKIYIFLIQNNNKT